LPVTEVVFTVLQYLTSLLDLIKRWSSITWYNGSIIKEVDQTTPMTSQDDLLLSALNCSCEVHVVGLLELLPGLGM
jgi:hypothetical protein